MAWLDSVSSLNLLSRQDFDSTVLSAATEAATPPLFLQDQGTFSSTRELLGNLQVGPQPKTQEFTKLSFFNLNFPILLPLLDLYFSPHTTTLHISLEFL